MKPWFFGPLSQNNIVSVDGRVVHLEPRSNPPLRYSLKESQFYCAAKSASVKTDFWWDSNPQSAPATLGCESWLLVKGHSNQEHRHKHSATVTRRL